MLTLLAVIAAPNTAAPGGEEGPAALRIVNGTEAAVLRCQLVLAHFMTRDLPAIGPGRDIEVELRWQAMTGTLLHGDAGGRETPVENLLCGADRDWDATRADVDLTSLREAGPLHLHILCRETNGLSCAVLETPD